MTGANLEQPQAPAICKGCGVSAEDCEVGENGLCYVCEEHRAHWRLREQQRRLGRVGPRRHDPWGDDGPGDGLLEAAQRLGFRPEEVQRHAISWLLDLRSGG